MTEKVIHEFKFIETDDGFRIEVKGDKERIKEMGFGPLMGFGRNRRSRRRRHGHHRHHGHGRMHPNRHGFGPGPRRWDCAHDHEDKQSGEEKKPEDGTV